MMIYVSRPRIVPDSVESRKYQVDMAGSCLKRNTLVILPTGLGKTVIALLVSVDVLEKGKKVLILAPTKPLVEQHYDFFKTKTVSTKIGTMNGNMDPKKRASVIADNDVIVCTPQVVSNDLDCQRYDLNDFGLIIYDEAHRATGNYAYVNVSRYYHKGLSMGMTASPGHDKDKIMEVCENLGIEKVEIHTDEDEDVSPYIHDVFINRIEVNMPEDLKKVIELLNKILDGYIDGLRGLGLINPNWPASIKQMISIGRDLQMRLNRGEKSPLVYRGLVCQSAAIKIMHAIELAETQGMSALRAYIIKIDEEGMREKGPKSSREIVATNEFKEVSTIVRTSRVEHPKISRLMRLVSIKIGESPESKILVFTQYRDTCDMLIDKLSKIEGAHVAKLIGQSKGGLKQKEQVQLLEDFKGGKYNVIVSTSVGEEGLDIASTDMVVFYEPIPSEIRTIQRRGRTGRKNTGEVYVLVAVGTRDEISEKTSAKKEEQMKALLDGINDVLAKKGSAVSKKQFRLDNF